MKLPDEFVAGAMDVAVLGTNLDVIADFPDGSFQLIYLDPPFNTGTDQTRSTIAADADAEVGQIGFGGRRYRRTEVARRSYADTFADYPGFLRPRLEEARRLLRDDGTLYVHLDAREVHYIKVLLDSIFGRECFLNEIIWAYDYGGRPRRRWPNKHDTLLVYVATRRSYYFDREAIDRIPYMAPGLVTPEKAARGKLPTDVWWQTIVPTSGKEKTGYPTQKPEAILRRLLLASSAPGGPVLDFFAGSGTTGAVARELGRSVCLVDENPEAVSVMRRRLGDSRIAYLDADGATL